MRGAGSGSLLNRRYAAHHSSLRLPSGFCAIQFCQFCRIKAAVELENSRRRQDINQFDSLISPDWTVVRDAIRKAGDIAKLRRVWPAGLGHQDERAQ